MSAVQKKDITVIEVSYEVCNKVGGIHTVITSKIARMMDNIQNYIAIGPYYEKPASIVFEKEKPPVLFQKAFNSLNKKHGINCFYGRWSIQEQRMLKKKPVAILIDPGDFRSQTDEIKREMWEFARVDSTTNDWWYNEPLPWSYACGLLIEELIREGAIRGKVAAHFHEFLTGAGLLYLKKNRVPVRTVFTTHATMLGRSIAGTGREDIHSMISDGLSRKETMPDDKAREYHVLSKHSMERASAVNADIFTTVSDVTGRECEFILGRKPEIILYNGLDMAKFPDMEDLSHLHISFRDHMRKFLTAYFSPYYPINTENTLFYFISGRFEFHNKGLDVFIDALGKLNRRLKNMNSKKTVIVFVWVPCNVKGRDPDVMDNLALFEDLDESISKESRRISKRIMDSFAQRKSIKNMKIVDEAFLHELKKAALKIRRKGYPPMTPFSVDPNDITKSLESSDLLNRKEDMVKIVYYPTYLSSTDGIMGLNYYDAMIGSHVGVFPSYYESWGYTPLEAAALGCQSITTDLAGYGKFISPSLGKSEFGVMVIPRENKSYQESVDYLENLLYRIYSMSKSERGQSKIRAKQLSMLADWSNLIKNYLKAYEMALSR